MEPLVYLAGVALLLVGLAGVVLPGLPGSPLLLAGAVLVAWAGDFTRVGRGTIAVEAFIAGLIFTADYVAGALGAKAFGASRWAFAGALLGLVAGLFFGLPGIVLGPALGAFALELLKDPDVGRAARAGIGVLVGFVVGSVVKVALALVFVGVLAFALLV